jgi:glyoxylase-like metal-dependent hydrolase (beta-lactamase superfamily II)
VVVRQLRVGTDNFSYLLHDPETREAALIDPGFDASEALRMIKDESLDLKYLINTHHHSDHSMANGEVLGATNAILVASQEDGCNLQRKPDMTVDDGDEIKIGTLPIRFLKTPGHTPGGICMVVENEFLITGDTLFIGDCGRCDLPGGSIVDMFKTLQRLKRMDDDLVVFPGHDYGDKPYDTLGNQKRISGVLLAVDIKEFSTL